MTEKEVKILMAKYLKGTITVKEEKLLEKFDASLILENEKSVFKGDAHKKQLSQKMLSRIKNQQHKKSVRPWLRIAASVAIVINIGALVYYTLASDDKNPQTMSYIVKSTDWGKRMDFILADGTEVKLNSGSTISFPESFEGNTREVKLVGEAFFNVAKNTKKPFIIKSGNLSTTVLGTSFNINAYPTSDNISVTVATGKVQIGAKSTTVLLHPNEQGVFHKKSDSISKKEVNSDDLINWKKGILKFDDIGIKDALTVIEKWYGVTFTFKDDQRLDCHITASFDSATLSNVLESISYVKKGLSFEYLEDNDILIKGKCIDKN
ncbi:FecR family protein [Maribacter ulvicola]|uniref:FecR family protein n=1 Tax=Maribacter ulvicola TaxID=228959 RepID=A0A1N6RKS0_9FLAO|nr:FecR family protein [Maribacter ulvicola]SIQ29397.1 FecR family protein [Maribacter ulvicola]